MTLMATEVAGTVGENLISINASGFINTYIGTGPKVVRELHNNTRA